MATKSTEQPLSDKFVAGAKLPLGQNRHFYLDTKTRGLMLIVGPRSKVFAVRAEPRRGLDGKRKASGAVVRLGEFDRERFNTEAARTVALGKASEIRKGETGGNGEAGRFAKRGSATKRVSTADFYADCIERRLADWLDTPLRDLSERPADVALRFREISVETRVEATNAAGRTWKAKRGGKKAANQTMVCLRAIYNYVLRADEGLPVKDPTRLIEFWDTSPRVGSLDLGDKLKDWHLIVQRLQNPIVRAYLVLVLLTGGRRRELARAEWCHVDMEAGTSNYPITKTKAWTIPLSKAALEVLTALRPLSDEARREYGSTAEWLFPAKSKLGHMCNRRRRRKRALPSTT